MALPTTGPISLADVRAELGLTGPISLGQAEVRALAGIPTGPISLGDLRGKSNTVSFVVGQRVVSSVTYRGYSSGNGGFNPFNVAWGSITNQTLIPAQPPFAAFIVEAVYALTSPNNSVNFQASGIFQDNGSGTVVSPDIRLNGGAWRPIATDGKGSFYVVDATYRNLIWNNVGSTITIEARWP